jgi:hypothetical protein
MAQLSFWIQIGSKSADLECVWLREITIPALIINANRSTQELAAHGMMPSWTDLGRLIGIGVLTKFSAQIR